MSCAGSTQWQAEGAVKKIRKPKAWKHTQPIARAELMKLREEFWDTSPHYGGRKDIWDALRAAAAEADISCASNQIFLGVPIYYIPLTSTYSYSAGAKYELPKDVVSEPTNLVEES
ncbi:hypothetical protein Bca4012_063732 [Brassica carinata]